MSPNRDHRAKPFGKFFADGTFHSDFILKFYCSGIIKAHPIEINEPKTPNRFLLSISANNSYQSRLTLYTPGDFESCNHDLK